MKKTYFGGVLSLLMCLVILLSLFACDDSEKESTSDTTAMTEELSTQLDVQSSETDTADETESSTGAEASEMTTAAEAPATESTGAFTTELTEALTTESTEALTTEPTEALTTESTEAPTTESTEAFTTELTEALTTETTEAPTTETTEAPTTETTEPEETETETEAVANADYYLSVEQGEIGKTFYFNAETDGYSVLSTDDIGAAVKVRLESTEGGFYLSFIKNAEKFYINASKLGPIKRITLDSTANTVYTYDRTLKTLVCDMGGELNFLGMYGEFRYFTLSSVESIGDSFAAALTACGCEHSYMGDADGHYALACDRCGQPNGEKTAHDAELLVVRQGGVKQSICPTCSYAVSVEVCDGDHYVSDENSHRKEACDICGTNASDPTPHGDIRADGIRNGEYVFTCDYCGYAFYSRTIGEGVTYMYTPRDWGVGATTYYNVNRSIGEVVFEDGLFPYGSVHGSESSATSAAQVLFQRSRVDNKAGSEAEQNTVNIGKARYLVFKVRTTNYEQSLNLRFSTTGADGSVGYNLPISQNDTWQVIVINLASVFPNHYMPDATGNYTVDTFYFTIQPMAVETKIDIAYMAFVEGAWTNVDALVEEENVLYAAGGSAFDVDVSTGPCTQGHSYTQTVIDGKYASVCAVCETVLEYNISADSATKLFSPDSAASAGLTGKSDRTVMTDNDGTPFVRIDNFSTNGKNWAGITLLQNVNGGVTGQYMVIKLRIGENGLGQSQLKFYVSTDPASPTNEDSSVIIKVSEDGQWHIVVIDLAARVRKPETKFVEENDGYHIRYLQMRQFHGKQSEDPDGDNVYTDIPEPDDYMDIAYIAFFDELSDLAGIVSETTYEWSSSSTVNVPRKTVDGSCASDCVSAASATVTDGQNGDKIYTYACSACGTVLARRTVPAGVAHYEEAGVIVNGFKLFNGTNATKDVLFEGNIPYASLKGTQEIAWARSTDENYSNQGYGGHANPIDIGNSRYLVIKARSDTRLKLSMSYSTVGSSATTVDFSTYAEAVANGFTTRFYDVTTQQAYYLNSADSKIYAKLKDNVYSEPIEDGAQVFSAAPNDDGKGTIIIPLNNENADDWQIYVVDLTTVVSNSDPSKYVHVQSGDSYIVDFLYGLSSDSGQLKFADRTLDIEYIAFAEDWTGIAALAGGADKTVEFITAPKTGAVTTVMADGSDR